MKQEWPKIQDRLTRACRLESLNSMKSKTAPCPARHERRSKTESRPQRDQTAALSTSRTILTQEKGAVKLTRHFPRARVMESEEEMQEMRLVNPHGHHQFVQRP